MTVNYTTLAKQLDALIADEEDPLANSANLVGLLFHSMNEINWLGIYVVRGDELVLGPFQGLPACVRIPIGRGVCGTAAGNAETLRVADIHAFAGHIACDPVSQSEIVVPLIQGGRVFAVLDIDSPLKARFSAADQAGIEQLCEQFVQRLSSVESDLRNYI